MANTVTSPRAKAVARLPEPVVALDMPSIYMVECSGNPKAYNTKSKALGLGQITPIVVQDWNNMNPRQQLQHAQMADPVLNQQMSTWYANKRAPQLLRHYGVPDTVDNRLIAYNAGIDWAIKHHRGGGPPDGDPRVPH